ncbi:Asp-tRNA(Asn)/Glu-tRNA(Gln) amidotransferase subunit GatC [Mycoplasmoides genitalium]
MGEIKNTAPTSDISTSGFIYFAVVFLIIIVYLFFKNILFLFFFKRYPKNTPKIGVSNITTIAMIIAVAVSVVLVLMALAGGLTAALFRGYPGFRVTLELILVKISGLLFGPIIGIFSAATIDFLTVIFSGGVFNIGYVLGAILTGMIAGILREVLISTSFLNNKTLSDFAYLVLSMGMVFASFLVTQFFVISVTQNLSAFQSNDQIVLRFNASPLNFSISLQRYVQIIFYFAMVVIITMVVLYFVWIIKQKHFNYAYSKFFFRRYKHANHQFTLFVLTKENWFYLILNVITLATTSLLMINIAFIPIFDTQTTGQTYDFWLLVRLLFAPLIFLLDIIVIYPILLLLTPIMLKGFKTVASETQTKGIKKSFSDMQSLIMPNVISHKKQQLIRKEMQQLAKTIRIDLSDKEVDALVEEFKEITKSFNKVTKIDTTNVRPMYAPFEFSPTPLRKDKPVVDKHAKQLLNNCCEVKTGFVKV